MNPSLKQLLIDNHTEANRGVITGHAPLEYVFGLYRPLRKISKGLGLALELKTSNRKRTNSPHNAGRYCYNGYY